MTTTAQPTRAICPRCGEPVERVEGVISERVITVEFKVGRRTRPAVYWQCWHCEWCGERLDDP